MKERTVLAQRVVVDYVNNCEGVLNIIFNQPLIQAVRDKHYLEELRKGNEEKFGRDCAARNTDNVKKTKCGETAWCWTVKHWPVSYRTWKEPVIFVFRTIIFVSCFVLTISVLYSCTICPYVFALTFIMYSDYTTHMYLSNLL